MEREVVEAQAAYEELVRRSEAAAAEELIEAAENGLDAVLRQVPRCRTSPISEFLNHINQRHLG